MSDNHEQGLDMRRQVMGDAFVDRALGNATGTWQAAEPTAG